MSSVVISGDTSGAITLAAPAVSGTNTATLPSASGTVMVSGNMPAFSAWKSNSLGTQSITTNTYTKITFDTEDFDTNNNFASSRFTPTVAGYYQINAEIDLGGSGVLLIGLFKNGTEYKRGSGTTTGTESYLNVQVVLYMNGSTDYLEVYAISSAGTGSIYATTNGQYTYFNGCLVRAA